MECFLGILFVDVIRLAPVGVEEQEVREKIIVDSLPRILLISESSLFSVFMEEKVINTVFNCKKPGSHF